MDYFKPETKYYIINIFYEENDELAFGEDNLFEYVKETFPVLHDLERERIELLHNGVKKSSKEYSDHIKLMHFALSYLNLPKHLLAKGYNDISAIEPVTGIKIESMDSDIYDLEDRRVSDVDLEIYYISDYEEKAKNFFNPSFETKRKATVSVEELAREKTKTAIYHRKKGAKKLLKEMN